MHITDNPSNNVYENLIDLAFDVCDEFILVVHTHSGTSLSQNAQSVLNKLKGSLIEVNEQTEWPGTVSGERGAQVYHYKTTDEARHLVKRVTKSLYSWMQPGLPEDLSFVRNRKPWLINIAHERESFIETESEEDISRILAIQGLKAEL